MSEQERYHHVSASPTLPTGPGAEPNLVTLAALLDEEGIEVGVESVPALREKARQAYYWIVNNAIISPHYDIAYGQRDDLSVAFREGSVVTLPTEHSFCSYV
ncbi:MAG: ATPase, partial [Myxococcota bacterium]|nr:ATPase [Myxococcota bacterium]